MHFYSSPINKNNKNNSNWINTHRSDEEPTNLAPPVNLNYAARSTILPLFVYLPVLCLFAIVFYFVLVWNTNAAALNQQALLFSCCQQQFTWPSSSIPGQEHQPNGTLPYRQKADESSHLTDCKLQISWPIRLMQWLEEDLCELLLLWEEQSTEFVLICEQSSERENFLWSAFAALHGGTYEWWPKTCWTDCWILCAGNQRR